jgi:YesN/AraC family two-component response regulator
VYKVVLVDDEEIILRGLCDVVPWEKYNCKIIGKADDGQEGIKLIKSTQPDMIFTDIRMPNMDGIEMLYAVQEQLKSKQVTVMTGFRDLEYAQQAIKLGVTRYLLKPSEIEEIEEAILCMIQHLDENKENSRQRAKQPDKTENYIVNNVLDYIESAYNNKMTLADIAEKNYVSVWHLSKLINKYCHKSFRELLNQTRIKYAKELLTGSNAKIYEVAENVGITDITYFSKMFKKYTGITPNEYRNQSND